MTVFEKIGREETKKVKKAIGRWYNISGYFWASESYANQFSRATRGIYGWPEGEKGLLQLEMKNLISAGIVKQAELKKVRQMIKNPNGDMFRLGAAIIEKLREKRIKNGNRKKSGIKRK